MKRFALVRSRAVQQNGETLERTEVANCLTHSENYRGAESFLRAR